MLPPSYINYGRVVFPKFPKQFCEFIVSMHSQNGHIYKNKTQKILECCQYCEVAGQFDFREVTTTIKK